MLDSQLQILAASLILATLTAGIGLLLQAKKMRRQTAAISSLEATGQEQERAVALLRAEVQRLQPFAQVADADAEARRLLTTTRDEAVRIAEELRQKHLASDIAFEQAKAEAEEIVEAAGREAAQLIRRAETEASAAINAGRVSAEKATEKAKLEAAELLTVANRRAARIIQEAEEKATETAGEAMKALREAQDLEGIVVSLKNRIEGYGREYLIPGITLLDKLAEDYDFSKASQDYKFLREQINQVIRVGKASTCDYVEAVRRETAIRFVLDAFNGKVDSALSRLRHDNYGKLKQEIIDAYKLVNANGRPFRSARITKEYLDLRLEELRLGVVLVEMKAAEVAEQKRIKEQIREEQRAQKEFERAMREATKEQETLQRVQERVRVLYEAASDEQKQKYEAQLSDLAQKLAEAEAKNQRALSMAQQTKSGHVYIISNIGSFGDNVFKIGMTRRLEPSDRIRELGDASVPFEFDVHAMIFTDDAPALERSLHKRFALSQVNKINSRKEFFHAPITELRRAVEALGIKDVHWTITAQARRYRETLALEEILKADPLERQAWLARQGAAIDQDDGIEEEAEDELAA